MSDYRAGDTVRLPLEGVVWLSDAGIKCITVSNGVGSFHIGIPGFPNVEVIKRATPPEPTMIGAMVGVDLEAGPDDACVAIRLTDEPGKAWEVSGSEKLRAWEYFVTSNNTVTILSPGGEA